MTNEEIVTMLKADGITESEHKSLIMQLYDQNMPLLKKLCYKYKDTILQDDMLQECYLALVKSVEGYDTDSNKSFVSYWMWIINNMVRMSAKSSMLSGTSNIDNLRKRIRKIQREYANRDQPEPTPEALATMLNASVKRIRLALRPITTVPLDSPLSNDTDQIKYEDILPSGEDEPESAYLLSEQKNELTRAVQNAVDALPPNEAELIRAHDLNQIPLTDYAAESGKTYSQVKWIREQAFKRLRGNKELIQQMCVYESVYDHTSLQAFINTNTSSQEWYVLNKDRLETELERLLTEQGD